MKVGDKFISVSETAKFYYDLRQEFLVHKATPHLPGLAGEKYARGKKIEADLKACETLLKEAGGIISPWRAVWVYEYFDEALQQKVETHLVVDYWASKRDPRYPNGAGTPTTDERLVNWAAADAEFARLHPGKKAGATRFVRTVRRTKWA